jgi:hypothetical protein
MLGAIEQAMHRYQFKGVTWTAKTLTDRGRYSQEHEHGADFAGVLSIELPGYSVKKGFLAQAKLVEPGSVFPRAESVRLIDQCRQMLERTPDAYVFVYSITGIRVVPAAAVIAANECNPNDLYYRSVGRFYEDHFECFIGDTRINAPTPDMLEALQRELRARKLLYLDARADALS